MIKKDKRVIFLFNNLGKSGEHLLLTKFVDIACFKNSRDTSKNDRDK